MDILNPTDLKSLISQQGKWCVSLYMPTHRVGREQQQNPVRFKNLLAKAETNLIANGLRRPKVQDLMQPAEELLADQDFWQHQSDGLAMFLSNEFFVKYQLPASFKELLLITRSTIGIRRWSALLDRLRYTQVFCQLVNLSMCACGSGDPGAVLYICISV